MGIIHHLYSPLTFKAKASYPLLRGLHMYDAYMQKLKYY